MRVRTTSMARFLVPIVAAFTVGAMALPQALGSPGSPVRNFTSTISPNEAASGSVEVFTYNVRVEATNTQPMGSFVVPIPSGFTFTPGSTLTATAAWGSTAEGCSTGTPGSATWTATYNPNTVVSPGPAGPRLEFRSGSNARRIPASRCGVVTATFALTAPAFNASSSNQYSFPATVQQSTGYTDSQNFNDVGTTPTVEVTPIGVPLEEGQTYTFETENGTGARFTLVTGSGSFVFDSQPCEQGQCIGNEITVTPFCGATGCRGLLTIEYANGAGDPPITVTADALGKTSFVYYEKPEVEGEQTMQMCNVNYTQGELINPDPYYHSGNPQGSVATFEPTAERPIPCLWKYLQTGGGSDKLQLQIVIDGDDPTIRTR